MSKSLFSISVGPKLDQQNHRVIIQLITLIQIHSINLGPLALKRRIIYNQEKKLYIRKET